MRWTPVPQTDIEGAFHFIGGETEDSGRSARARTGAKARVGSSQGVKQRSMEAVMAEGKLLGGIDEVLTNAETQPHPS